jgi:hypothetical protein
LRGELSRVGDEQAARRRRAGQVASGERALSLRAMRAPAPAHKASTPRTAPHTLTSSAPPARRRRGPRAAARAMGGLDDPAPDDRDRPLLDDAPAPMPALARVAQDEPDDDGELDAECKPNELAHAHFWRVLKLNRMTAVGNAVENDESPIADPPGRPPHGHGRLPLGGARRRGVHPCPGYPIRRVPPARSVGRGPRER